MKLLEIMAENWKVFGKMGDEGRLKNIEVDQYNDTIANSSGIDIREWDLHEIFASRGNSFIVDLNEINKRFFAHNEKVVLEQPRKYNEMHEALREKINAHAKQLLTAHVQKLERDRQANLDHAKIKYNEYLVYMGRAWQAALQVSEHSRQGIIDVSKQLEIVETEGFWTSLEVLDNFVYLTTRAPIVNIWRDTNANVDIRADYGNLVARLDLTNMSLALLPQEGGPMLNTQHYHPYVDYHGQICFGNASDTVRRALASGNLSTAFRLLAALLSTYDVASTPYVGIANFSSHPDFEKYKVKATSRNNSALAEDRQLKEEIRQRLQQAS